MATLTVRALPKVWQNCSLVALASVLEVRVKKFGGVLRAVAAISITENKL
jgi:hypothetical protein